MAEHGARQPNGNGPASFSRASLSGSVLSSARLLVPVAVLVCSHIHPNDGLHKLVSEPCMQGGVSITGLRSFPRVHSSAGGLNARAWALKQ